MTEIERLEMKVAGHAQQLRELQTLVRAANQSGDSVLATYWPGDPKVQEKFEKLCAYVDANPDEIRSGSHEDELVQKRIILAGIMRDDLGLGARRVAELMGKTERAVRRYVRLFRVRSGQNA